MTSKNNPLEAGILHHESASVASFWTSEGIFFSSRNFAHFKACSEIYDRTSRPLREKYLLISLTSLYPPSSTSIILRMHKGIKNCGINEKYIFGFRQKMKMQREIAISIEREIKRRSLFLLFPLFHSRTPTWISRSRWEF